MTEAIIAPENWAGLKALVDAAEKKDEVLWREAESIYTKISEKRGKGANGLYRHGPDHPDECTGSNAMMGIFAYMLGKRAEGEELYMGVKEKIGRRRHSYKKDIGFVPWLEDGATPMYLHWALDNTSEYADDNAAMAILACMLGKKEEAEDLYGSIKKNVGTGESGLYRPRATCSYEDADTNALMGILAHLLGKRDEAEAQYGLISEKIGKDEGTEMYGFISSDDDSKLHAHANALMGTLAFLLGKNDEARELCVRINKEIGRDDETGLFYRYRDKESGECADEGYTDTNAAIGILACLLAGAEMKPR